MAGRPAISLQDFCRKKAGWGDFLDVLLKNGENHVRTGCLPVEVDDLTLVCPGSNKATVDWLLACVIVGWGLAFLLALWIVGTLGVDQGGGVGQPRAPFVGYMKSKCRRNP